MSQVLSPFSIHVVCECGEYWCIVWSQIIDEKKCWRVDDGDGR